MILHISLCKMNRLKSGTQETVLVFLIFTATLSPNLSSCTKKKEKEKMEITFQEKKNFVLLPYQLIFDTVGTRVHHQPQKTETGSGMGEEP